MKLSPANLKDDLESIIYDLAPDIDLMDVIISYKTGFSPLEVQILKDFVRLSEEDK